jgi:hypothetical protein
MISLTFSSPNLSFSGAQQSQVMGNVLTMLAAAWPVLLDLIVFLGIVMVIASVFGFIKAQREGLRAGFGYTFAFFAGIFMTSINAVMDSASESFFNTSSPTSLSLSGSAYGGGGYGQMVAFVMDVLMLWGLWAYYKSFVLLREAGDDRQHFAPAMWHFIGGVFAVNAQSIFTMLGLSLGGLFQSVVTHILGG